MDRRQSLADFEWRMAELGRRVEAAHLLACRRRSPSVEATLETTTNSAYQEAAVPLRNAAEILDAAGKSETFEAWIRQLRTRHRAKRNLLDR